MGYLLDTNIVSEPVRRFPNKRARGWLSSTRPRELYLSVMTLGEIRNGIEGLRSSSSGSLGIGKKLISVEFLTSWFEDDLLVRFQRNIIDVDRSISDVWGRLMVGRPRSHSVDILLASTALVHGLVMVTLNEKDFRGIEGLEILNPNRQ